MRALRGRAETIESDRAVTRDVAEHTRETGDPAVRVWRPHEQVAFGRRDTRSEGYETAQAAAKEHGFPTYEREVGGRAVAYTGNTVAFARMEPIEDIREGMQDRYSSATTDLQVALSRLGVHVSPGEPPDSFCPGSHSLQIRDTGKIVGIAQRIQRGVALVAGIVVVCDHESIANVLAEVYAPLDIPFDPDSVGSIESAESDTDPEQVTREIERSLAGEEYEVERVRQD